MAHTKKDDISNVISSLWVSGKYSDMKIKCGGRVFDVHRAIVCQQSKIFAAMMDGEWKEATDREIDLPEDDCRTITKMLEYLYERKYDDSLVDQVHTCCENDDSLCPLVLNTNLYICGDKYDIPGLKTFSKSKYSEAIKKCYGHAGLGRSLELIYSKLPESDEELKNIALDTAATHLLDIYGAEESPLRECLDTKENGHVLSDIVKLMAKNKAKENKQGKEWEEKQKQIQCLNCLAVTVLYDDPHYLGLMRPRRCTSCGWDF